MLKQRGVLVGGSNKNFRPANKSKEEINSFLQSTQFNLPAGKQIFLEFKTENCIAHHEHLLKLTLDQLQQQGSEIQKSDLRKMHLWEVIFLDTKYMCNRLVTLKDTMSRQQINTSNSKVGPLSLFQLVAEKYNDADWVVYI